ncbi:LysR substrate-binding domain-containing protein, partial [Escherichia coli]|uniref:LysR substrate-binding domain-containing protein n=1 Tax=Escherichia coli TaxID=562 RepID=UPI003D048D44
MINIRQLEAFRAVVVSGSVTQAAARLNVSQPAVSNLISNLERETGLTLFQRNGRRLALTKEGHLLHAETEKVFYAVSHITRMAEEIRTLRQGQLTIGSMPSMGLHYLPTVLGAFLEDKPNVNVTLLVRDSAKVVDWVMGQQIDLGVSVIPSDHPAVENELLATAQGVCAVPLGHRLVTRKSISAADLTDERFISLGWEDRFRHLIDQVFETATVARKLVIETPLSEVACSFVAGGAGVSIVDPFTAQEFAARKVLA